MKFFKNIFLSIISILVISISITSCGSDENEKVILEGAQENDELNFVSLLERDTSLAYEEFIEIKKKFNTSKDAYLADNRDYKSLLKVIEIYIYEARVTGEHPYYYSAALQNLNYMLKNRSGLDKDQLFNALFYKATVQLSQHHFNDALKTGSEALGINDVNSGIYGVLVDANVELGNYEEAVKMSDKMVALRPDLRSYSRISYLREIYGDMAGSKVAMNQAIDAGAPYSEYKCWAITTLGKLFESEGKLDSAALCYNFALQERKGYPFAIAGNAEVQAKKGNVDEAIKLYNEALNKIPEIGFTISLAKIKKQQNDIKALDTLIPQIEEMFNEDIASGHNMNMEYALFVSEFKNDNNKAIQLMEAELKERPQNIDVNKALALIYAKIDQFDKAKQYIDIASRTNKLDAEIMCIKGIVTNDKELVKKSFKLNPYQDHALVEKAKQLAI